MWTGNLEISWDYLPMNLKTIQGPDLMNLSQVAEHQPSIQIQSVVQQCSYYLYRRLINHELPTDQVNPN